MLGYLSVDIICSEKRTAFRERSPRKTVSYGEQIMSKDNANIARALVLSNSDNAILNKVLMYA